MVAHAGCAPSAVAALGRSTLRSSRGEPVPPHHRLGGALGKHPGTRAVHGAAPCRERPRPPDLLDGPRHSASVLGGGHHGAAAGGGGTRRETAIRTAPRAALRAVCASAQP